MREPSIKNKVKALRLSHLVLSLGWEGARTYLSTLSPEETKEYFADPK